MGIQIQLGKIYKRLDHTSERGFARATHPSLEIRDLNNLTTSTEKIDHYISNSPTKPTDISEMTKADVLDANTVWAFDTTVTWSCFIKQNPLADIVVYSEGKIIDNNDKYNS